MKKSLTICLVMAIALLTNAQTKLSGTVDIPKYKVNGFDKINFEIKYKVVDEKGTIKIAVSEPKVLVHPDSKYNYQGKLYSRQDLGLASWPQTQKPISFGIYLSAKYPEKTVNHIFSCTELGDCKDNNEYILRSVDNKNSYKTADFQVSYNNEMTYTGQRSEELDRMIKAKLAKSK